MLNQSKEFAVFLHQGNPSGEQVFFLLLKSTIEYARYVGLECARFQAMAGPPSHSIKTFMNRKMAKIHQLLLLIGLAASLGACSNEQLPPSAPSYGDSVYPYNPATVRKVQVALRNRGYYAGVIDGFIGQNTAIGIQRFQIDHCQRVHPIVDRSLMVALGLSAPSGTHRDSLSK